MTVDDRRDVIFTGIGGQGVQLCSKVLANAAVAAGHHVMLSSYFGGEMRGGRTEATVITRDQPVDLPPIVPRLDALIVLHPAFLGDALPRLIAAPLIRRGSPSRSEEHTSELQSHLNLVCRLLLE